MARLPANSVYLKAAYRAEISVALKIKTLINQPTHSTEHLEHWLTEFEAVGYRQIEGLSKEQVSALFMAVKHPISTHIPHPKLSQREITEIKN